MRGLEPRRLGTSIQKNRATSARFEIHWLEQQGSNLHSRYQKPVSYHWTMLQESAFVAYYILRKPVKWNLGKRSACLKINDSFITYPVRGECGCGAHGLGELKHVCMLLMLMLMLRQMQSIMHQARRPQRFAHLLW